MKINRLVIRSVSALMVFASLSAAQSLPAHFTGAGLGFQNSATPKASGWTSTCVETVSRLYACAAVDYSGGTTSTRAEAHPLVYQYRNCALFGTAGAGAATSPSGGVGGSFDAGGVAACHIPEKLVRAPGVYAVFSGSWNKRNVVEAPDAGSILRTFGSQTIWRFGFGKAW